MSSIGAGGWAYGPKTTLKLLVHVLAIMPQTHSSKLIFRKFYAWISSLKALNQGEDVTPITRCLSIFSLAFLFHLWMDIKSIKKRLQFRDRFWNSTRTSDVIGRQHLKMVKGVTGHHKHVFGPFEETTISISCFQGWPLLNTREYTING